MSVPSLGRCGEDVGDHPPITPMRAPTPDEISGTADAQIFDYVIRHFFGTVRSSCIDWGPCEHYSISLHAGVSVVTFKSIVACTLSSSPEL